MKRGMGGEGGVWLISCFECLNRVVGDWWSYLGMVGDLDGRKLWWMKKDK